MTVKCENCDDTTITLDSIMLLALRALISTIRRSTYMGHKRLRIVCCARRHKRLSASFNFPTLHVPLVEEVVGPFDDDVASSRIVSSPLCCRFFLRLRDRRRFTDIHNLVQSVVASFSPSLIEMSCASLLRSWRDWNFITHSTLFVLW